MPVTFDASQSTFGILPVDWGPPLSFNGTVQSSSSTSFQVLDADGRVAIYTGTGFSNFNDQGFPLSGTITGYTLQTAGGTVLITLSGLDQTGGFPVLSESAWNAAALSQNATITGSAFDDTFYAGSQNHISLGAGNDTIIVNELTTTNGVFDGGSGTNTLVLAGPFNSGSNAYLTQLQGAQLTSFQAITFQDQGDGKPTLGDFDLSQWGGTGLALTTHVTGTAGMDTLDFSGASAGTYDFSQMTFSNWTIPDRIGDPLGDFVEINASAATAAVTIDGPNGSGSDLIGGSGNDTINGGNLADFIVGGPGNDTINGGSGDNVAGYTDITISQATITHNQNGSWTVSSAADGTDTLTNIPLLDFSNGFVALQPDYVRRDNFLGDGKADLLIQNGSGAVVAGESQGGGAAAYTQLTGLGPEWKFVGDGDFYSNGVSGFLIENTSTGAVVTGELSNGSIVFQQVSALGPEWTFKGTGTFLGHNDAQFLIENTGGAVVVGEIGHNGQASYLQVASLASTQKIVATGDFFGDGQTDFLVENADGSVQIAPVNSQGQSVFTTISGLGPEWTFVGAGNLLGDSKSDFLIENSSGAVVAGEVQANDTVAYTQIAALGPEWKFVGVADYMGDGHDQFLIENNVGAVVAGDWVGGAMHFTQVAGLGPEWLFH
jgi:hypothetical protein